MSFSEVDDLDIERTLLSASRGERSACTSLTAREARSPGRSMPQQITPGLVQKVEVDPSKQT